MSCFCDACGKKVNVFEIERNTQANKDLCDSCHEELQEVINRIHTEMQEEKVSRVGWAAESFIANKTRERVGP